MRSANAIRYILCGLAAIGSVRAQTQQDTLEQEVVARCARLTADSERLACYDAAASWIEAARGTASAEANTGVDNSDRAEDEKAVAPGAASATRGFGAEQLGRNELDSKEEIHSRFVGEFSGWRGNTRFPLENGQVWQQDEPGRMIYRAENPEVTIRRAAMGTYLLSVEGVRRALRVRRLE
jgi:hypothetical protein